MSTLNENDEHTVKLKKAITLMNSRKYKKAIEILNKLIRLRKVSLTTKLISMVVLANILKIKKRYGELAKLYDKIIEYIPSYKICLNAAENYLWLTNYRKAISLYNKALNMAKNNNEKILPLVYQSVCYVLSGKINKGKETYKKARDINKQKAKRILETIIKNISKNKKIKKEQKNRVKDLLL